MSGPSPPPPRRRVTLGAGRLLRRSSDAEEIVRRVEGLPGVLSTVVDRRRGTVTVTYDPTRIHPPLIRAALRGPDATSRDWLVSQALLRYGTRVPKAVKTLLKLR